MNYLETYPYQYKKVCEVYLLNEIILRKKSVFVYNSIVVNTATRVQEPKTESPNGIKG